MFKVAAAAADVAEAETLVLATTESVLSIQLNTTVLNDDWV